MKTISLFRRSLSLLLVASLSGCATLGPEGLPGMQGDMMGLIGGARSLASRPTSVGDVMGRVATVMAIVAVVQKYADLNAAQQERVRRIAQARYEAQLEAEKRALSARYAKRRAEARRKAAEAKRQPPAQAARAEQQSERELEKIDREWREAAASSVSKKYGSHYAIPVKNPEGKPVVALASIKDGEVQVASSAYEVGGQVASGSKVRHAGREYAVIDQKVSL